MADLVIALHSFVGLLKGVEVQVHEGDILETNDPIVKSRRHLFGPITVSARGAEPVVEQASAAPGELRGQPGKAITTDRLKGKE